MAGGQPGWSRIVSGLLWLCLAALLVCTGMPFIDADLWWVRAAEFPRVQLAGVALLVGGLLCGVRAFQRDWRGVVAAGALASGMAAVQGATVWPWAFGEQPEGACTDGAGVSVLIANVKLENDQHQRLLSVVRSIEPDLLFVMETDEGWDATLSQLSASMPYGRQRITGSFFGLHVKSRHPLVGEVTTPVAQDTPAVDLLVEHPDGPFRFVGIHPRPPTPSVSSAGRDGQLMWAAFAAREADEPVVVGGDFNAVPWSGDVRRLGRVGRLIDPRRQVGYTATYAADSWWMRWALDHVLHSADFTLESLDVLPSVGSDHHPVLASFCRGDSGLKPMPERPGDVEAARAAMDTARQHPH